MTSQEITSVGSSKNGSTNAVEASGSRIMSDSLMPFQPAIDEPSNILPSVNNSSSIVCEGTVTCCSLPRVSQKRKSTDRTRVGKGTSVTLSVHLGGRRII